MFIVILNIFFDNFIGYIYAVIHYNSTIFKIITDDVRINFISRLFIHEVFTDVSNDEPKRSQKGAEKEPKKGVKIKQASIIPKSKQIQRPFQTFSILIIFLRSSGEKVLNIPINSSYIGSLSVFSMDSESFPAARIESTDMLHNFE